MTIQKIITVPNPLLRQKSKVVTHVDKKIQKVIADLLETVKSASEPEGLGLSAIQIGQPVRIFVAKTKNSVFAISGTNAGFSSILSICFKAENLENGYPNRAGL